MMRNSFLTLSLLTALCASAGNLSIGVANAVGSYSVNSSLVTGNTDVFEGTRLETTNAPSEVRLQSGADLRLATKSTGEVFNDHLVLEQGAVRVGRFENYPVEARKLQIQADSPDAEVVVRLKGNTVEVASLGGGVRVSDGGAMLTRVAAGTRMSFKQTSNTAQAQTGAQAGLQPGRPKVSSDEHILLWFIVGIAAAAVTLGVVAGVQGKNPF